MDLAPESIKQMADQLNKKIGLTRIREKSERLADEQLCVARAHVSTRQICQQRAGGRDHRTGRGRTPVLQGPLVAVTPAWQRCAVFAPRPPRTPGS